MTRPVVHAITPGDHYSPRTGSAIPTVVHGLANASAHDALGARWQHHVLVAAGTFRPRYESARVVEYQSAPLPTSIARVRDAVAGRVGLPRRAAEGTWAPVATSLAGLPPSVVVAHNAPVLPSLVDTERHRVVLYAHNELFRSVAPAEALRTLDMVSAIICVSEDLADRTARSLPPTLSSRVRVVHNGVDPEQFAPRGGASPRPSIRFMFVGRVVDAKGPDVLLRAAALLPSDRIEVVVVGSAGFDPQSPLTRYERSLRRIAAREGIAVTFQPFVDRDAVPDLLRTADVFVMPARWQEPSGLTLSEAMASGIPVIASRVGGIPEVVGDAGVLVAPDSPGALAQEMRRLLEEPALRKELGSRGRARAVENDWSRSWSQFRRVLEDVER